MGVKLLWTGITVWVSTPMVLHVPSTPIVGAVLMVIWCILMWLDR